MPKGARDPERIGLGAFMEQYQPLAPVGAPGAAVPAAAAPGGVVPVGAAEVPGAPVGGITPVGAAATPWGRELAEAGGLMGLSARQEMAGRKAEIGLIPERAGLESTQIGTTRALAAGEAAPGMFGALGTPYGTGIEMEEALGGLEQRLQQRGLYGAGLVPALGVQEVGRIQERSEQRRRAELAGLLQLGMTPRGRG